MDTSCSCSQPLEPWRQPLTSQQKGLRRDGRRLGELQGYMVDGVLYANQVEAARAQYRPNQPLMLNRPAYKTPGYWEAAQQDGADDFWPVPPGPAATPPPPSIDLGHHGPSGVSYRSDAGEVEVVVDGIRRCEDPRTGEWKPCSELAAGVE